MRRDKTIVIPPRYPHVREHIGVKADDPTSKSFWNSVTSNRRPCVDEP